MTQIFRAALFILLCGVSYAAGLVATSNIAHAQTLKAGDACAPNGTTAVSASADGHINLLYCKSGSWVASSLVAGASLDTCNTAAAGVIKWNGTAMKYCNGTDWADFTGSCAPAFSCGLANGGAASSAPSTVNLCSNGTATAVTTNATHYTWSCSSGSLTVDCAASRLMCGATHNGAAVKTPPTSNLCVNGTASAIITNSITQTYNWSCNNAGLSVNCMVSNGSVGPTIVATGASKTSSGDYDIYRFNGNGTFKITAQGTDPAEGNKIEYLIVGGGGGGGGNGNRSGGGGGAGGLLEANAVLAVDDVYDVVIGAGGAGAPYNVSGSNGSNSSFGSRVALGGGGGGSQGADDGIGRDGASGGGSNGGCRLNEGGCAPGKGIAGQGHDGGSGNHRGGGGGGAAGAGQAGTNSIEGAGGLGKVSSITGAAITYAAGGGGGSGVVGAANSGNGGGGVSYSVTGQSGKNGGSGIVIIKVRKQ